MAFEFPNRPLGCFKILEVTVDVEFSLKKDLSLLKSGTGGLGSGARKLERWKEWSLASWTMSQEINRTDGVQLSTQVVENHSKIFPTPYKTKVEDNYNLSKQIAVIQNKEFKKICEGLGV
jgi:hypothetical protein